MVIATLSFAAVLAAAPAAAATPDPCAPLHEALGTLYHTPLKHSSLLRRTNGQETTTEYVLTAERQYTRFLNSTDWMSTPLGEADRAALDAALEGLSARPGLVCTEGGEETVDGKRAKIFLIDDAQAHSSIRYWVAEGRVIRSVTALAGASLTDTYSY